LPTTQGEKRPATGKPFDTEAMRTLSERLKRRPNLAARVGRATADFEETCGVSLPARTHTSHARPEGGSTMSSST
jgi:hypothetical protein